VRRVRCGREKKNENIGRATQLGGGDQVLARFYSRVWREPNRIASDFQKGAKFLREGLVRMSVR
jgi:hypothetical protein